MINFIADNLDHVFVITALIAALIAQTKASAITAAEFILSVGTMAIILAAEINTPFMWLAFALYAWGAAYFHVKCTSNPVIITGFALAMLYYLGMFMDWGFVFWSGAEPGILNNAYGLVMPILVLWQLTSTVAFGGFRDGLNRWKRNIYNRNTSYLCVIQGSSK